MARLIERATAVRVVLLGTLCLGVAGCVVAPAGPYQANPYPPVPQARVEIVPRPPRPAMVWQPGHYLWDGHGYRWVPGRYLERRGGEHWVAGRWVRRGGGWFWVAPHWQ